MALFQRHHHFFSSENNRTTSSLSCIEKSSARVCSSSPSSLSPRGRVLVAGGCAAASRGVKTMDRGVAESGSCNGKKKRARRLQKSQLVAITNWARWTRGAYQKGLARARSLTRCAKGGDLVRNRRRACAVTARRGRGNDTKAEGPAKPPSSLARANERKTKQKTARTERGC